jgi:hypothetical protein
MAERVDGRQCGSGADAVSPAAARPSRVTTCRVGEGACATYRKGCLLATILYPVLSDDIAADLSPLLSLMILTKSRKAVADKIRSLSK